ncbi:MAG: c-type cytochrome [Hyphomicrobiaceae bacterium]
MTRFGSMQALCVMLTTAASCAHAAGNAEQGREISQTHCSRCHVIGDFNKYGGIGSTPSFQSLANNFPDYVERFETFYARRPHPAFLKIEGFERLMKDLPPNADPITLPVNAVADILAFVGTLRTKK